MFGISFYKEILYFDKFKRTLACAVKFVHYTVWLYWWNVNLFPALRLSIFLHTLTSYRRRWRFLLKSLSVVRCRFPICLLIFLSIRLISLLSFWLFSFMFNFYIVLQSRCKDKQNNSNTRKNNDNYFLFYL